MPAWKLAPPPLLSPAAIPGSAEAVLDWPPALGPACWTGCAGTVCPAPDAGDTELGDTAPPVDAPGEEASRIFESATVGAGVAGAEVSVVEAAADPSADECEVAELDPFDDAGDTEPGGTAPPEGLVPAF